MPASEIHSSQACLRVLLVVHIIMAVLAICYVCTAEVASKHGKETRRYIGVTKLRGRPSHAAAAAREQRHAETPVKWLAAADASTLVLRPCGHAMAVEQALAQEALLTAQALFDGGPPCRGGPWALPWIGVRGRAEARAVYELWCQASDDAAARAAVLEYGQGLGVSSYLRLHLADAAFHTDSAAVQMGERAPLRTSGPSGRSRSGHDKRLRKGWAYTSAEHVGHKWGSLVTLNRSRNNDKKRKR